MHLGIKTRFAPSPSGDIHLGNLRIAFISWLYSYTKNGSYFVRIDNTDILRSNNLFVTNILNTLYIFKITFKKLYFQSKRLRLYRLFSRILFFKSSCYFLNKALYFSNSYSPSFFYDCLRSKLIYNSFIYDFVVFRSNFFPTYNFSCVIDDHLESVTHIFRGSDHIDNTFKQISLIKVLNFSSLKYYHLPLLLNLNGSKISKRFNFLSVRYLLELGILRRSILLYILSLGYKLSSCIYNVSYYAFNFKLSNLLLSSFKYDIKKLLWYNKFCIKNLSYLKVFLYVSSLYFSVISFNRNIFNFLLPRCKYIYDFDYLYNNYFLSLFCFNYSFVKKIIFYFFSKILEYKTFNFSFFFRSFPIFDYFYIYKFCNLFFFGCSFNVPSLSLFLSSLGFLNIILFLNYVLFI